MLIVKLTGKELFQMLGNSVECHSAFLLCLHLRNKLTFLSLYFIFVYRLGDRSYPSFFNSSNDQLSIDRQELLRLGNVD